MFTKNYQGRMLLMAVVFLMSTELSAQTPEAMTIDKTGNISINTTVVKHRLNVNGNSVFGIADNTAFGVDAQANARLGFVKKFGTFPQITSAQATPIIFSQINQGDIFTNISTATLTERMRIDANGNVGIAFSNTPGYKLTIGAGENAFGVENTATFSAKNTAGNYENYFWPRWSDNIMYMNYGTGGFNIRNNTNTTSMFMTNDGNVGIGNTAPGGKLDVQGNIYTTIARLGGDGHGAAYRGKTRIGQLTGDFAGIELETEAHKCGNGGIIKFFTWGCNTDYSREVVRITEEGRLGINTKTPDVPLHVNGFVNRLLSNFYFMFQNESRKVANANDKHNNSISILASNGVEAAAFYAMSDMRIKKDLAVTDNAAALDMINQLEVTRYHHKDEIMQGSEYKTGFVAQQVEKIFPQAVQMRADFVPDIFTLSQACTLNKGRLVISMNAAHNLVNGDVVRLITASGQMQEVTIKVQDAKTFVVDDWNMPAEKVFVYGKKVNDMRSVDYQQIFSMGISAIQQLSKTADELKSENELLKSSLEKLMLQVKALEEKVNGKQ